MTEEQKQIRCAKARIAADDLFRSLEELIQMGHIESRREHAHLSFIRATATLVALAGDFVPEEVEI